MERILVKTLLHDSTQLIDQPCRIAGWVRTLRTSKTFGFIEVNDGSCFKNVQVVFADTLPNYSDICKVTVGSAISLEGMLVASLGKEQAVEIKASAIAIVNLAAQDYPLQKKRHSFEYLRTIAHLRPRANTFQAVFRVRSLLAFAIHRFLQERSFVYVHTPIITASDCEGAGQMFQVTTLDLLNAPRTPAGDIEYAADFFGKQSFLTVSGQLNVEAFCMAFDKVYTFGPTFRAENSNTQRHASEFWMIEPEIAFADLGDNMALAEAMIKYVIGYLLEHAPEELEFFNRFIDTNLNARLQHVFASSFAHLTYTEAIQCLQNAKEPFQYTPHWGMDLQTEHERYLAEKHVKRPVFITDYPKEIKAFYMRLNDDGKTVAAMDLLVPEIGEIIGGSQREERFDILQARIEEMKFSVPAYNWYLDIRKYGGTPHAGFGLGFERAVMYMTGMQNIRDVIPYPRTPKNAEY